jgi:hypothetical protein
MFPLNILKTHQQLYFARFVSPGLSFLQQEKAHLKSAPLPMNQSMLLMNRHRYCPALIFLNDLITVQCCTFPDADNVHGRSQLVYMHLVRQVASFYRYFDLLAQSSQ